MRRYKLLPLCFLCIGVGAVVALALSAEDMTSLRFEFILLLIGIGFGPTTPLTPLWFDLGVDLVAGLLVEDVAAVWPVIQEGGQHSFFDRGTRMVQIERAHSTKGSA